MKDIVLAGIQWSGKWTQAQKLIDKFGDQVTYFEAGGILRALQSSDNAVGNYIGSVIDNGHYMPDDFMVGVYDLFVMSLKEGAACIVDGFPRQLGQMHWFIERMKQRGREFIVIDLELPEDKAVERLLNRRLCKPCWGIHNLILEPWISQCPSCGKELIQRKDEVKEEYIRNRFGEHYSKTGPVMEHFEGLGIVRKVNGDQEIDKVFEDVLKVVTE